MPDEGKPRPETSTEALRLKAALYDPNTKLYTISAVMETVRSFFHRSRVVGLIHCELDPKSKLESIYGWQVLDGVLASVSAVLRGARGRELPDETVICQTGVSHDRFVLFIPQPRPRQSGKAVGLDESCALLGELIARRFEGEEYRTMTPGPIFNLGAITLTEHPFHRLERLVSRGLDEARRIGARGEGDRLARRHAELKRIIREEEIETFFQPILDLGDQRVIGYEAFVRGPRDTMFESPGTLFAYSDEVGMSVELDLLCQRAAVQKARDLPAGQKLFLNALPASLLDPGFRESLLAFLPGDSSIAREDIVLDIADRSDIDDVEAFGPEVLGLRTQGFRVSIDDFGKASLSLDKITKLRPDFIKVDRSLIRDIDKDAVKREVLRSLCKEARTIDSVVIAEGIETAGELLTAKRCGVTLGQGYLFCRPTRDLPPPRLKLKTERGEM